MSTSEFELPPSGPARGVLRRRVLAAAQRPAAWVQLLRFAAVGASGTVVNLAVYALVAGPLGLDYRVAAVAGFAVAVTSNFALNRAWTFRDADGHAGFQAARFLTVSLTGLAVNLVVLHLLVDRAGADELLAQAVAIVAATPMTFVGNKLWSFAGR